MRHCSLYMSLPSSAMLPDLIRKQLPGYTISGSVAEGAFVATKKGFFSKQRITFSFRSAEFRSEEFARQMDGMANFFASIPTERGQVQKMLLGQIARFTIEVHVEADKAMDEATRQAVTGVAGAAYGLVLLPPGNFYTGDGELVFDTGGNSDFETYTVSALPEVLEQHTVSTPSGERRKQESIARLKARNVPYIEHLPPIVGDENICLRSQQEVVERTLGLLTIALYACECAETGLEGARVAIDDIFGPFRGSDFLSPAERAFMEMENPDPRTGVQMSWRYECAWAGLWALGLLDTLPYPNSTCSVGAIAEEIRKYDSLEDFARHATLRPSAEILNEADLIYRYHWACVDARIKGQPAPAGLDPGVVMERHYMFNWLIRYRDQEWDEVSPDT